MVEPTKFEYLGILRCRTYHNWPEWSAITSEPSSVPSLREGRFVGTTTPRIVTYASRPFPHDAPLTEESRNVSPLVWHGDLPNGFVIHRTLFKDPSETVQVVFHHKRARQGEIDIQIGLASPHEISFEQVYTLISPFALSLAAALSLTFNDLVLPVAPLQIRTVGSDGTSQIQNDMLMSVRTREDISAAEIASFLDMVSANRSAKSEEEQASLDVALRRFLSSLGEDDPIDRFCDLWEACEFLAKRTKAKGDVVSRIAQTLADHTRLNKKKLENGLSLRELYSFRSDLVHNAIEHPDRLDGHTRVLEAITRELLKYRLGMPYSTVPVIEAAAAHSPTA